VEIEVKKEGIFIPRKLLEELEIEDAEVVLKEHEILLRPKSVTRKLKGFVKTKLTVKELDELYMEI
jgi:antitoxin component of MazEF toxin-antitoxin module